MVILKAKFSPQAMLDFKYDEVRIDLCCSTLQLRDTHAR